MKNSIAIAIVFVFFQLLTPAAYADTVLNGTVKQSLDQHQSGSPHGGSSGGQVGANIGLVNQSAAEANGNKVNISNVGNPKVTNVVNVPKQPAPIVKTGETKGGDAHATGGTGIGGTGGKGGTGMGGAGGKSSLTDSGNGTGTGTGEASVAGSGNGTGGGAQFQTYAPDFSIGMNLPTIIPAQGFGSVVASGCVPLYKVQSVSVQYGSQGFFSSKVHPFTLQGQETVVGIEYLTDENGNPKVDEEEAEDGTVYVFGRSYTLYSVHISTTTVKQFGVGGGGGRAGGAISGGSEGATSGTQDKIVPGGKCLLGHYRIKNGKKLLVVVPTHDDKDRKIEDLEEKLNLLLKHPPGK